MRSLAAGWQLATRLHPLYRPGRNRTCNPPVLETRQKKPGGKDKGERRGSLPFCRRDRHKKRHSRCDRNLEGGQRSCESTFIVAKARVPTGTLKRNVGGKRYRFSCQTEDKETA